MTRRRTALGLTGLLAAAGSAVTIWIQVDRWLVERRQMEAQGRYELAVEVCEAMGGRWWRGSCEKSEPDR